ncbi:MAG: type II methionyl aminopeptidase [Nanoarchaeota archaeon]
MQKQELADYKKAGEIAKQVVAYAKEIIKPNMLLVELANKIHKKIEDLGAISAFPVNFSINEIAAHYHPTFNDETKANGLLKIDLGVAVNGYIADTAFSLDLTPDKKYKKLIESAELALENALNKLKQNPNLTLNDIGKTIEETIKSKGFSPIVNLSGHSLEQHNIHAGLTIPNYANSNNNNLKEGAYAIEPFATTGEGRIYEGESSNIYGVINPKNTRSETSRKILDYVYKKYKTLPFSLREVQEKFGALAKISVKQMVQEKILHEFPQLIEESHHPVAQAEHTFIKTKEGIIVTTR